MADEVAEATESQVTTTREEGSERLRREFNQAAKLGRNIFNEVSLREEGRLTPYFRSADFNRDNLAAIGERGEGEVTEEEVLAARRASLGIGLEAAVLINEARLPRGGPIREDLESLGRLRSLLRATEGLRQELFESDPALVGEQMRVITEKRSRKEDPRSDEALNRLAKEQLEGSYIRISRSYRAIEEYSRY